MAIALVKSAKSTSALATVSVGFASPTTAGNIIVLAFASDDYNGTPPSGWNESSEMEQQGFHGAYLWWRISAGETNFTAYTIGSATNSSWLLAEFSGVSASPYDTSQGVIQNTGSSDTLPTDPITPAAGNVVLVALLGGSGAGSQTTNGVSGWTNSFSSIDTIGSGGAGSNTVIGVGYRLVTGDGVTTFSTAGVYAASSQSRSALIIALKEATGTTTLTPGVGSAILSGKNPSTTAFQNIRIRDVLVNGSGQALANAANISLLVWYGGRPVGAPDLSYSALTTDSAGSASWSIPTGPLSYLSPIFYLACGSDSSLSAWTCARMIPSYE